MAVVTHIMSNNLGPDCGVAEPQHHSSHVVLMCFTIVLHAEPEPGINMINQHDEP